MWEQVIFYIEHPNGIDALLCLLLLVTYLRRYCPAPAPEQQPILDPEQQRIRELVDAGCILMAAEKASKLIGEEGELP